MTNEEWERHVDFIIGQQAQFTADVQRLGELHAQAEARMNQAEGRMTNIENVVLRLANATENRFNTLTEKMTELAEAQLRTDEKMAETDERLNSLINVVERYISEGRNGKS